MNAKKVKQVREIAKLFGGFANKETTAESVAISWSRWEGRITRLNELSCNDSRRCEWADGELERIRKELPARFGKLFRHSKKFEQCFFVNGDPRGHALKIDLSKISVNKRRTFRGLTDWGGDAMLSPEC